MSDWFIHRKSGYSTSLGKHVILCSSRKSLPGSGIFHMSQQKTFSDMTPSLKSCVTNHANHVFQRSLKMLITAIKHWPHRNHEPQPLSKSICTMSESNSKKMCLRIMWENLPPIQYACLIRYDAIRFNSIKFDTIQKWQVLRVSHIYGVFEPYGKYVLKSCGWYNPDIPFLYFRIIHACYFYRMLWPTLQKFLWSSLVLFFLQIYNTFWHSLYQSTMPIRKARM